MADTIRTRAQILTLLADNTTGEISPQDMRDMLVSLMGVYGIITMAANVTGQALTADTPAKLINWKANGLGIGCTPDYANGQITVDNTGVYKISAFISVKSNGVAQVVKVSIRVDGVEKTVNEVSLDGSGGILTIPIIDAITVNATEVITVYLESDTTETIIAQSGQLTIERIG